MFVKLTSMDHVLCVHWYISSLSWGCEFKYRQAKYCTFLVWQCRILYEAIVCTVSAETQAKHLVPPQCKYCMIIYKEIMVITYSCFTANLCNYTVSTILSCLVQRLRIVLSLRPCWVDTSPLLHLRMETTSFRSVSYSNEVQNWCSTDISYILLVPPPPFFLLLP